MVAAAEIVHIQALERTPRTFSISPFVLKQSSEARKLNCSSTTAMEVFVRRVWLKHPPFSVDAAENLRNALEQWEAWRRKRVEQARYSVFRGGIQGDIRGDIQEDNLEFRAKKNPHQDKLVCPDLPNTQCSTGVDDAWNIFICSSQWEASFFAATRACAPLFL